MASGTPQFLFAILASTLLGASAAVAVGHIGGPSGASPAHPDLEGVPSSPSESAMAHDHGDMDMAGMDHATHSSATPWIPSGFDAATAPDLSHAAPFPLEGGKLPTLEEAQKFTRKYSRFIAKGDEGIDKLRAEGYFSGKGTPDSPYVLEKFYVSDALSITSTDRSIIIRDGYVAGQLKLNYIGESLYVHHVYADDLRVNENVERHEGNTGGLFENNQFAFVGQIRHFVGEFRNNQVGPKPGAVLDDFAGDAGIQKVPAEVVFNFDGFHAADVHHNHFLGMVDMKLHGHNHGDAFTTEVHDHSLTGDADLHSHAVASNPYGFVSHHSIRYTSLLFRDNVIEVPGGTALRYNDRNHAGDDRTANSEPNKALDDPHIHFQDITVRGNKLVGGRLVVEVFNAQDDKHTAQNLGILRLEDNEVQLWYQPSAPTSAAPAPLSGIQVLKADGLELRLERNQVTFQERAGDQVSSLARGAYKVPELRGIQLDGVDASNLTLAENFVSMGRFGVWAQTLSKSVYWTLEGNEFHTDEAWKGKDVGNPPEEKP